MRSHFYLEIRLYILLILSHIMPLFADAYEIYLTNIALFLYCSKKNFKMALWKKLFQTA